MTKTRLKIRIIIKTSQFIIYKIPIKIIGVITWVMEQTCQS